MVSIHLTSLKFHNYYSNCHQIRPRFSLPLSWLSDSAYFLLQFPKPLRVLQNESKQLSNLKCNQTYHPPQVALFLSFSPPHMTYPTLFNARAHSSGKFTAWFLVVLSTGKLHSIRKSIYIPVGREKEFPLEFDEMTT